MTNTENPRTVPYRATYSGRACTAYVVPAQSTGEIDFRYFSVLLSEDPGFGSMNFDHIGRGALVFVDEPPAVVLPSWVRPGSELAALILM